MFCDFRTIRLHQTCFLCFGIARKHQFVGVFAASKYIHYNFVNLYQVYMGKTN